MVIDEYILLFLITFILRSFYSIREHVDEIKKKKLMLDFPGS